MTTKAVMAARIASELRRPNISTQIASAITTAIEAYQHERFDFSVKRSVTVTTVADQEFYDSDDTADLAQLVKIDFVIGYVGDTEYRLNPMDPERIELLSQSGTNTGEPSVYCWYGEQLRFGPVPDAVYTIRVGGEFNRAAPATDGEASNPWMTTAERLIRCRAKYELYEHVLLNPEMANRFHPENESGPTYDAYRQLIRRTAKLQQQGGWRVTPTDF